jgi:hypothetical protein
MSTDDTVDIIKSTCNRYDVPWRILGSRRWGRSDPDYFENPIEPKVEVVINDEKLWEVGNVLAMIRSDLVREDDIICRLDGDDFLCDLCALQDLNAVYESENLGVCWTAHRWGDTLQNISGPLPPDADPYKHEWVSSHFKTFRKFLITDVDDENFRGEDGKYIKRTGDQAIYLPVLWQARERKLNSGYLPRCMYYYTIDMRPETFQTEDAKFQRLEGEFIRRRGYV